MWRSFCLCLHKIDILFMLMNVIWLFALWPSHHTGPTRHALQAMLASLGSEEDTSMADDDSSQSNTGDDFHAGRTPIYSTAPHNNSLPSYAIKQIGGFCHRMSG